MRFFEHQQEARSQTLRLLLLFAVTIVALVLAMNAALALVWQMASGALTGFSAWRGYPQHFFAVNTGVILLFVLGGWWLETSNLRGGGEKLARRVGAREAWPASRDDEQRLCNIIDELAIAASLKPPLAMVLPRVDSINAFAAGWDEGDAVVAVTQGALDRLTRDELMGLVAHEFSHIREGDIRLNMRLAGMVFGLEMLFNLGRTLCEPNDAGRRTVVAIPGFAIEIVGSLGWLAGRVLKAAVSRQREFLADARAVQFTRSRQGLAGVLRKIAQELDAAGGAARAGRSTAIVDPAVQHMLLVGTAADHRWFASHPPLAERIRRIEGLSARPHTLPADTPTL
ncbi:M48 family metalloprotease [Polaromonas sp. YR568]|uniref:M48 family metalloprotease n=1 Tax=Polaromonas sp. YR568 TaxID=1855301 RepID=UPI003137CC53